MKLHNYVGNKAFYRKVIAVSLPIMIQTGITNLVNLLDNVMVGRLGTESMSAVSIVNQYIFIFNLMIFGAISAAGIFTSQYHGLDDEDGERYTFRFKLLISIGGALLLSFLLFVFDDLLISLFLHNGSADGNLGITLLEGKAYLRIMLIGLIPYALSQVFASTMRETEQTVVPMVSSIIAVSVNFILNYVLIFGKLGLPALGVRGAAIATVIARFAELLFLVIWGYSHLRRCRYLRGAFHSLYIPKKLFFSILGKGLPLMLNEVFWSLAITMRNQCYSTRGLEVVAAQNISSTIVNVFNVIYMAVGSSIGIIVGNLLGAGKLEEAKDTDRKMMTFSVACALVICAALIATSSLFPAMYNTTDSVRALASFMMIVSAIMMPFNAFAHSAYFTMRSGGQVFITILFDSVYMWAITIPLSMLLSYETSMSIHWLFFICQGTEILKVMLGVYLLRRGTWVRQLVGDQTLKN